LRSFVERKRAGVVGFLGTLFRFRISIATGDCLGVLVLAVPAAHADISRVELGAGIAVFGGSPDEGGRAESERIGQERTGKNGSE